MIKPIPLSSWSEFKNICIARKNLNCQYRTIPEGGYEVFGPDSMLLWFTSVSSEEDILDFESSHKDDFNWAIGNRPYPFSTGDMVAEFDAVGGTVPYGSAQEFDYQITTPKCYMNGAYGFGFNVSMGDWIEFQVVDKDGLVPVPSRAAYPAYPVLSAWVKKWYVAPSPTVSDIKTPYAGHPPQGMYIRLIYHSTGTSDPQIYVNYYLHEEI